MPGNTHLYYDPSGDNFFNALDALIVVNSRYRQSQSNEASVDASAEPITSSIQSPLLSPINTNRTIQLELQVASPEQALATQKKVPADFVLPDTELIDLAFMQRSEEETILDDSFALELQAPTTTL